MDNNNLPPGFISIDDAVAIIKANTREDPAINMDYVVNKSVWIETNHNFRIPRIKRLKPEQIYRNRRGKIVEYEEIGEYNVAVNTNYEKELLKKTILDKYRELVGHEYKEAGVRAVSTVADDAQGREAVQPRANKPIAKEGAYIGGGETITSNGEGISV